VAPAGEERGRGGGVQRCPGSLALKVNIDSAALASLQNKRLAIGLTRIAPSPDISAALCFCLPATSIIGTSFAITVADQLRCFAAVGAFRNFEQATAALTSPPIGRGAVDEGGVTCIFDGTRIAVDTTNATPGLFVIADDSPGRDASLTMGLAETFRNTADNAQQQAPSLLRTVDTGMSWALAGLPASANLFLISDNVPIGTVIPPTLTPRKSTTAMVSLTIGPALLVDLGNAAFTATFNPKTNRFEAV
jgi:hypothetical protein